MSSKDGRPLLTTTAIRNTVGFTTLVSVIRVDLPRVKGCRPGLEELKQVFDVRLSNRLRLVPEENR